MISGNRKITCSILEDIDIPIKITKPIIVEANEWVQYSTPNNDGAEYIAVCLPAFSPDTVHRDDE